MMAKTCSRPASAKEGSRHVRRATRMLGAGGGFLIAILQAYDLVYKLVPFELSSSCHHLPNSKMS